MSVPETGGRASAIAPGTCGELAQGMLDGILCMVTCPIDLYSVATVELSPAPAVLSAKAEIPGPCNSPKARQAVRATLDFLGARHTNARLWLESPLPRGKGMGSSTADVSAAIVATASAMGFEICPAHVAGIALGVEPSDGVMYPHITIFDHREGRIARTLGPPPPMRVVVLDFGGKVDTLEFNRADRDSILRRLEPRMVEAVWLIEDGISRGDLLRIGRGATISAVANQQVLFNPYLDAALEFSRGVGAVGINVAHSGTVVGLLFPDDVALAEKAAVLALRELPGLQSALCRRIVSGGVKGG
jgi:L-threonine kinase